MSFFKKKQPPKHEETPKAAVSLPEPVIEDTDDEIAAVIAAICAMGGATPSNLIVRNIIRVQDQTTNWNRIDFKACLDIFIPVSFR